MKNYFSNAIFRGTLILTLAGILTRLIGFFYKIFLSNLLGAYHLGIYQLIFPVYGLCFTIYASGIQTALSKLVAEAKTKREAVKILKTGTLLSLCLALLISFLLYTNSGFIAAHFLSEPECQSSLKILSFVFPFCGITACINGYYYGQKKSFVPAASQLLEQLIRVFTVFFLSALLGKQDASFTCSLAVFGIVTGEVASNLYNLFSLLHEKKRKQDKKERMVSPPSFLMPLLKFSIPLTFTRFLISILHSIEAVLIPVMLRKYGMDNTEAVSLFGILNGMSIPLILFPSTIPNSIAVLLLPSVSNAQANNDGAYICRQASNSIHFSLITGIVSTGVFLAFGNAFGTLLFHEPLAGTFLSTLSWLCPFLYLSATLGSILNGLGKTQLTFFNTSSGLLLRILCILFLVPQNGMSGYLTGLLISQLTIALLDILAVRQQISFSFDAGNWLLKPTLSAVVLGFLSAKLYFVFAQVLPFPPLITLALFCSFYLFSCLISLRLMRAV